MSNTTAEIKSTYAFLYSKNWFLFYINNFCEEIGSMRYPVVKWLASLVKFVSNLEPVFCTLHRENERSKNSIVFWNVQKNVLLLWASAIVLKIWLYCNIAWNLLFTKSLFYLKVILKIPDMENYGQVVHGFYIVLSRSHYPP